MGLGATFARRSLLQRPGRTCFSILGVAMGIATVVAVFTVDHVTLLSRQVHVGQGWGPDFEVRPSGRMEDPRSELESTPGVAGVTAFFQNDVRLRSGSDADDERVQLVALDAEAGAALGAYHVLAGRDLAAEAGEREVLVGRALAEARGLEVGQRLVLARPPRSPRSICREGELQVVSDDVLPPVELPFRVVGVIANEKVGRKSRGNVVVVDYPPGRELFEGAFVEPRFWIKRDPAVDVERLGANLGRDFSYELDRSVVIGQMEDERAFRNGVRLAGLLALILGLYVIFHTLSMSLVERVHEVAVLHSLGTVRGQVARIFFLEALFIASLAGVLGFAGGLGLAWLILRRGITTLGVVDGPVGPFAVPWGIALPLCALGVGIALIGSIYPLLRARRTDTITALRGQDLDGGRSAARGFHAFAGVLLIGVLPALYFLVAPVVGAADSTLVGVILAAVGVAALLVGLPVIVPSILGFLCARLADTFERLWPLAGKLAASSILQGPTRVASSVAAIALVTAAFVGLEGMTSSLRAEVEIWAEEALIDKVYVTGLPGVSVDEVAEVLEAVPETVGVEPGDARVYVPFLLLGLPPGELARWGPMGEDPGLARSFREERAIVVSERLARHRSIGVGDEIAINTSGHGVQGFRVVLVSDEYGYFTHPDERMYGIVADRHVRRLFCLDTETTTSLAVGLRDGADPDVVEVVLRSRYPRAGDLRFERGADVLALHVADIDRDFVLFDIILGLTAVLAGIGVLNGQLLAALERAKEIGVLRALGMTRGQVAGMVLLESSVIGATGGILGLLVGSALTPFVVRALQTISGLPLPYRSAGPFLAWCLLGALVLSVLAGLYPVWRANRLDVVRAVRTG